jgi:hypothetical protein
MLWRRTQSLINTLGTSPGRLVEFDSNFDIIHQYPEDVDGTLNILGSQFSPHGLTVNYEKGIGFTSDFVVPITILKPSLGIQHANTLRFWNLDTYTIISTMTLPSQQPSIWAKSGSSTRTKPTQTGTLASLNSSTISVPTPAIPSLSILTSRKMGSSST